ncbi:MAG: DNA-binding response regulator [Bacteroidetes bacterium CG2_30_33_31]|nr:MAG: DNA-binding response regulator [Bacteroidetes bacterium CG2_30_33_31]
MSKILLVDDDPDILAFLSYNLEKEGFEVNQLNDGSTVLEKCKVWNPELIIMDVMMSDVDGIEATKEIRKHDELRNIMIVLLTARSEDYSQIAGYQAGADEYITKPIRPNILVSKVKALLRRKINVLGIQNFNIDDSNSLIIDKEKYLVMKNNKSINLSKKEFELLSLLASKPGKVFERDDIYSKVWGDDVVVGERTIDVHIRKLRSKIDDNIIKTVKGVGYFFQTKSINFNDSDL